MQPCLLTIFTKEINVCDFLVPYSHINSSITLKNIIVTMSRNRKTVISSLQTCIYLMRVLKINTARIIA